MPDEIPQADPAPQAQPSVAPTPDPAPTQDPPQSQQDWPTDWRERLAGDNTDMLKTLSRYNTPGDYAKAGFELRQKVSSGEYKRQTAFPADGTDEDKAAWRKENNIPDAADKYKLPEGLVVGDMDKPVIDEFLSMAHQENIPDGVPERVLDWYYKTQAKQAEAMAVSDGEFRKQTEDTLREEFGAEYRPIMNMAENFATTRFGEDVGKALMGAGPDVIKAVAAIAREIEPTMTVVPNSNNPSQAIASELESLSKMIGTPEWFRSPDKQARYQQLLTAQEASKKRGA